MGLGPSLNIGVNFLILGREISKGSSKMAEMTFLIFRNYDASVSISAIQVFRRHSTKMKAVGLALPQIVRALERVKVSITPIYGLLA